MYKIILYISWYTYNFVRFLIIKEISDIADLWTYANLCIANNLLMDKDSQGNKECQAYRYIASQPWILFGLEWVQFFFSCSW